MFFLLNFAMKSLNTICICDLENVSNAFMILVEAVLIVDNFVVC
jgi:hypothetical protein